MGIADFIIKGVMQGGPYGLALLGWAAWWYERRQNKVNSEHLLELATAQIEATVKHGAAIEANTKLMERFLNK